MSGEGEEREKRGREGERERGRDKKCCYVNITKIMKKPQIT